jgi:cytochrome c-type biogenesis protein
MAEWLAALNQSLAGAPLLALAGAVGWGVASILLSPCHLASIPLVIGYMSGAGDAGAHRGSPGRPPDQRMGLGRGARISLAFGAGMLLTIAGVAVVAVLLGSLLTNVGSLLGYSMAAVFLVVGLELLGVLDLSSKVPGVPLFQGRGAWGAFLLGLLFGLALGPCTLAFLAPVLSASVAVAATSPILAGSLTLAYGVGHCGVIVVAGSSVGWVQGVLEWNQRSRGLTLLRQATGVLLIVGGVYLIYRA